MYRLMYFLLLMSFSSFGNVAWQTSYNVTIKEVIQWEGAGGNVLLKLSDDKLCYTPLSNKELYSMVLSLYMSQKRLNLICHEAGENIGGYNNSHKIHRINAL